jgi:pyridoxal phosphate enzyme (YggS family)
MENLFTEEQLQERFQLVEKNLKKIQENIAAAARASGRNPQDITLLAATKTVPVPVINHAIHLGVSCIGENRVQELMDKYDDLALKQCACHFIGGLQTNKVKYLIGKVDLIESVDSLKLAKEISRLSVYHGVNTQILVEVNIGREENKSGVYPENLPQLMEELESLPALTMRGLMAIPPADASLEETKKYFLKMNEYFVDIRRKKSDNINILSMGMSNDYSEAIRCGANLVRVGSALFGNRVYK